jgi:hypothetical protein
VVYEALFYIHLLEEIVERGGERGKEREGKGEGKGEERGERGVAGSAQQKIMERDTNIQCCCVHRSGPGSREQQPCR